MTTEVKTWKCPKCGKELISLYDEQLEANKNSHKWFCGDKK